MLVNGLVNYWHPRKSLSFAVRWVLEKRSCHKVSPPEWE